MDADEESAIIRIERSRVSLGTKVATLAAKYLPVPNGWQILCSYVVVLSLTSLSLVLYLKLIGEIMPFCLYDNWYYLCYYFFLILYATVLIPLQDFLLCPPNSRFWCWARRIGAYIWFIETEGLVYFVVFYKDIAYDVEFDDEAQALVWSLASIGAIRFVTLSIAFWIAVDYLKRIQIKNKLSANHFGPVRTDLFDIFVVQSVLMSLYYYSFTIYNMSFLMSVTYIYVCFARI